MAKRLLPLFLALLLPLPALADDEAPKAREIALPREGFSLTVPAGWTFDQYSKGFLEVRSGETFVIISHRRQPPERRVTLEAWTVAGARTAAKVWFDHGLYGVVVRSSGDALEVDAHVPVDDPAVRAEVETLLASLDVRPFEHPERHVNWNDGWTIDLPGDWEFAGRLMGVTFAKADDPGQTVHVVMDGVRTSGTGAEGNKAAASFRKGTDPGGRVAAKTAEATDRFEREDGPKVVFRLPEGWTKRAPGSSMRIAEYVIADGAECVVFWFGGGDGGGWEANAERWKGQFQTEAEAVVTEEKGEGGIESKVFDVAGTYVAETRPGSGERVNKPGFRMLAALIATAEGPLFAKLVGPKDAVAKACEPFRAWLRSFRPRT